MWTEHLAIRSYDVDFTHRTTGASLARYFLEAAWNHAEALGVGFNHLARQGKFWILSRLLVEVWRYPAWGAAVTLRTWPRAAQAVFAMRDFDLRDDAGKRLAAGSSAWAVLDAVSRRPQRLTRLLPGLAGLGDQAALGRDPERLPQHTTWGASFSTAAGYTDIDVNGHVNSSRYIGWLLDAYPAGFHRDQQARTLEVNYLGETLQGDLLSVRTCQTGPDTYCHSLAKADGQEVCRARLNWDRAPGAAPAKAKSPPLGAPPQAPG